MEHTVAAFEEWAAHRDSDGPWSDRCTAPCRPSLPHRRGARRHRRRPHDEPAGGRRRERNWDYRYCWLRDASLTLEALLACGYVEETRLWRDWLVRAVAGDPADLQIMYAVDGGRELPERELDHLPGYAGSRPVRVGNGAVGQRQADVLGEVMIALEDARRLGVEESSQTWAVQRALVEDLADHWDEPDHGLWEIRGPRRRFTHSRVMVWAAFDRAVRAVEEGGHEGPVERWRELRDHVHAVVLEKGVDHERGTFVQHEDTTEVDAALLLVPTVGFLPPDHPLVHGTIRAVEEDLLRDGFVLRYRTGSGVDGLDGDENPFLACSWWLAEAYARCDGSTTRPPSWTGWSASPTTSASCPRSTTPRRVSSSATSRRRSPTSRSSGRRSPSGTLGRTRRTSAGGSVGTMDSRAPETLALVDRHTALLLETARAL